MYNYVFFDLDGTLTQSEFGILQAIEYTLDKMGEKSAQNLINAINQSKENSLDRLITAFGIRHIDDCVVYFVLLYVEERPVAVELRLLRGYVQLRHTGREQGWQDWCSCG